jgi:hypothetical protein
MVGGYSVAFQFETLELQQQQRQQQDELLMMQQQQQL